MLRLHVQGGCKKYCEQFLWQETVLWPAQPRKIPRIRTCPSLNYNRGGHRVTTTSHRSQHRPCNIWVKNREIKQKVSRSQRNMQPPKCQNLGPSQTSQSKRCGTTQRNTIGSNPTSTQSYQDHYFLPKKDMLEKLKFRVLWAIFLHRRAGSGNEHSRTTATTQGEVGRQQGSGNRQDKKRLIL